MSEFAAFAKALKDAPVCQLCDQKILAKRAGGACDCQTHRDCGTEGTHPIKCVICEKSRERLFPTYWTKIPTEDGERWAAVLPPQLAELRGSLNFWIGPYPMTGLTDLSHKLVTYKERKMIVLFDEDRLPKEVALFVLKPQPGYSMEYFMTGQITLRPAENTQSDMLKQMSAEPMIGPFPADMMPTEMSE